MLDPPSSDEEEGEGSGSSWSEGGDAAPVAVAEVTSVDVGVVLRPRNVEVSKHIMVVRCLGMMPFSHDIVLSCD